LQVAENIGMNPNKLESESQMDSYIHKVLHEEEMTRHANGRVVRANVSKGKVLASGVQSLTQLGQLIFLL